MSHDRGCFKCGREGTDEYEACILTDCPKKSLLEYFEKQRKPPKKPKKPKISERVDDLESRVEAIERKLSTKS